MVILGTLTTANENRGIENQIEGIRNELLGYQKPGSTNISGQSMAYTARKS